MRRFLWSAGVGFTYGTRHDSIIRQTINLYTSKDENGSGRGFWYGTDRGNGYGDGRGYGNGGGACEHGNDYPFELVYYEK